MGCFGSKEARITPQTKEVQRKLSKHSSLDQEMCDEVYIPYESNLH